MRLGQGRWGLGRPGRRGRASPLEPDDLSREVERLAGRGALPSHGPLDTGNPLHVDCAAAGLLARFFEHNDPAAFDALAHLSWPLLSVAARNLTREAGLAVPAASLVADYMARLFTDLAPDARTRAGGAHFLAAAVRAMEADASDKLRAYAESPAAVLAALDGAADPVDLDALGRLATASPAAHLATSAGLAGFSAEPAGPRLAGARGSRASRHSQALFSTAFHRLDPLQRRALLARDVDGLSLAEVAEEVKVGNNAVASLLVAARTRLADELAALLRTYGGRPPGRRGRGDDRGGSGKGKRRRR
jgi:DNA-directed RNA polymerase specialized sigma24 family protein